MVGIQDFTARGVPLLARQQCFSHDGLDFNLRGLRDLRDLRGELKFRATASALL